MLSATPFLISDFLSWPSIFQDYIPANCTKLIDLTKSASSVEGETYIFEHKIDKLITNNSGTYQCRIELEKDNWLNLTAEQIHVYSFNLTSKAQPIQVQGTENTLSCVADHPKVSEESLLKITWYKGTDPVKDGEEFKADQEVLSTLKLDGNWEDSAPFRCLFEFSKPFIKPTFSLPINIAYVGIYRSSMYRYYNQAEAVAINKLHLTKIASKDLPLSVYLQTEKLDSITGTTCTIKGIKTGETVVTPTTVTVEEKDVEIATMGTLKIEKDNSPFETASRWKVTAPLATIETHSEGKDVTVQCDYKFNDESKTSQFASFVVRTVATSAAYAETWPLDYMTSYADVDLFLTKSQVIWNTQVTKEEYNADRAYSEAGLLSTSPTLKYANWAGTLTNAFMGTPSVAKEGGKTTVKLSSSYATETSYKFITTYHSIMIASSTVMVGTDYFSSPSYVAYMPTIQTTNGTKVYATLGSTVTLTCSVLSGIVQVTWFRGTEELTGWRSYYNKEDKKVYTKLIIDNIKEESGGAYYCAAGLVSQSDDLWPVKQEISLFVVAAELVNSYAPVGQAVTLTCSMPTSQKPDEVLWYGNGQLLTDPNTIQFDPLSGKVLSLYAIASVKSEHFGTYKAVAYFDRLVSLVTYFI